MALPANGGTYANLLQPGINPLTVRKAIITDILIRDYRNLDGTVHNLADPAVGLGNDGFFSPFAEDGKLRSDLLGDNGLGFYHLGALHEDGTEMTYDTDVADTMIAQSKRAVRFDVTQDNDGITIKALEGTPLVDALRYDKPLHSLADVGQAHYTIAKDAETKLVERQVIAIGFDGDNYFAQTFPRMSLRNRGNSSWNKADADVMEIELGALLCPFVGKPALWHREGADWRGLQGYPLFATAPTAVAVAGEMADVTFAKPTSKSTSYEYEVEKSNDDGATWTDAVIEDVSGTATVTIRVSGVTSSASWKFRVKATGTNALTTTSVPTASAVIGLS
ncbi:major tail protein [Mycobacterium phage KashFlow]|uniref:major tail protein n=1 Tax=Mycobacterium phage Ariel TaxID=1541824 RepID=UPI0004F5FBA9|nr:major tail protein [Mycobacterium phage Ariel]AIM49906.1 major tail protein [Mycobacterium phage Ariel]QPO16632.1 major tail protein [Mycobacterium phage KashFlow]